MSRDESESPEWLDPRRTQYADMSDEAMHSMYARMEIRAEIERHAAQRKTEQLARAALEPRADLLTQHSELMATMNRLLQSLDASRAQSASRGVPPVDRAGADQHAAPQQDRPAPTPARSTPPLVRVYELRKSLGIHDNTDLRGMDDDAMHALLEHLEGEVALRASEQ